LAAPKVTVLVPGVVAVISMEPVYFGSGGKVMGPGMLMVPVVPETDSVGLPGPDRLDLPTSIPSDILKVIVTSLAVPWKPLTAGSSRRGAMSTSTV
jgi:hypothetical protein